MLDKTPLPATPAAPRMLRSKKSTSTVTAHGRPFPAGGGKKAARASFAVLAEDSDSDPEMGATPHSAPRTEVKVPAASLAEALAADAQFAALSKMEILWGDLLFTPEDIAAAATRFRALPEPAPVVTPPPSPAPVLDEEAAEEELWSQPFAENLSVYWADAFDTRGLTNTEFHSMLAWLYEKGWSVRFYDRNGIEALPDTLPPRRYIAVSFAETAAEDPVEEHHHHGCCSGKKAAKEAKAPVTIPRFCRAAEACEDEKCRYVHGDTIPRVNRPCGFGAECGASDPTGKKRSQCLYMHPGEEWTADLVIRRL